MAISCEPGTLVELASCFACLSYSQREGIKTYLLAVQAGVEPDADTLGELAKCFTCLNGKQRAAIQTYLLCQIANATPGDCSAQEGAGSPVGSATPDFIGQLYHRASDDTYWRSTGLTDADWVEISGASTCENTYTTDAATVGIFRLEGDGSIESVLFPNVTDFTGELRLVGCTAATVLNLALAQNTQLIEIDGCGLLAFNLPSSVLVNGAVTLSNSPALASVNLGSGLFGVPFVVHSNSVLSSVTASNFTFADGGNIFFVDCALNQASVDHVLARCVASGLTAAAIDLSGGTSAAPGAQGQIDKTALITAGCTVTTN